MEARLRCLVVQGRRPDISRRRRLAWSVFLEGLILAFVAAPLAAIEVRAVRWGFDGRIVPDHFNPLSIVVHNPAPTPFRGVLVLTPTVSGIPQGTSYEEPLFLSPGSGRRVHFYPHVTEEVRWTHNEWQLSWGRRPNERTTLTSPAVGRPARIFLQPEGDAFRPRGLPAFPAADFPRSVTATSGLYSLILDHPPAWSEDQSRAFRDWLALGGRVHVLRDPSGRWPRFEGALEILKPSESVFFEGAGQITHHDFSRRDAGDALATLGLPPAVVDSGEYRQPFHDVIQMGLNQLTRPDHNWFIIYTLSVLFVIIIGPVNGWMGRRWATRIALGVTVGTVVIFGFVFFRIGQEGFGQERPTFTLSYARALPDGRYDVTQWSRIFVTRGATYTIRHGGDFELYAPVDDYHRGWARGGAEGRLELEIPINASRGLLHRGELEGPSLGLSVLACEITPEGLENLVIAPGPEFPPETLGRPWVLYRGYVYPLRRPKDGALRASRAHRSLPSSSELRSSLARGAFAGPGVQVDVNAQVDLTFTMAKELLFAHILETDLRLQEDPAAVRPPGLHLFVFARGRGEFQAVEGGIEKQFILYHEYLGTCR